MEKGKSSTLSRIVAKKYHKHPYVFFALSALFVLMSVFVLWISTFKIPDLNSFEQRKVAQSTKIYDRTGKILLYDVHEGAKRTAIPFGDISVYIKNATVAIEDSDFYHHPGIKITSIIRAILANFVGGGYAQGGSTITQQVVKNSLLTQDKTISRKIKEWVIALKLERVLSKEEILSIYLNETSYGGNLYGVEEASKKFFGKDAKDVTLAEAAYIAAIPQATTYFSPYGSNKAALEDRKNLVLRRMNELGFINEGEYKAALAEKVVFQPQDNFGILAPHFVLFVKSLLEEKYGQDMVENGGLKVITTLDYDLQKNSEEILKRKALENEKNFNAENLALVAIAPKTGDILSMIGSRDYFDKAIDGNYNVATANRQPGSTFKPIVYSEAFMKGYTPDTVLFDVPTEFDTQCDANGNPILSSTDPKVCYMPENYDSKYRGPISLRNALAQSINIPSIKALYLAGIKDSLALAKNMGITTLGNADQYGLTLVLGGGEVSLLDMTSAYSVFANDGARNPYRAILSVTDAAGNQIFSPTPSPAQILPPEIARTISDILSDDDARAPSYGRNSMLYFGGKDVAVKTGTTNDYKDAWTIGYTPDFVVGIWAGNNDNSSMEKKVAGQIVAPVWNEAMKYVLAHYPQENFKKPTADYSSLKPILQGVWQNGEVHSILYWIDKNDPNGPQPTDPSRDPQFPNWEASVRKWAVANGMGGQVFPTQSTSQGQSSGFAAFISGIRSDSAYDRNSSLVFTVTSSGNRPVSKAEVYLNGDLLTIQTSVPFTATVNLGSITNLSQTNTLRVVLFDQSSNQTETSASFSANTN